MKIEGSAGLFKTVGGMLMCCCAVILVVATVLVYDYYASGAYKKVPSHAEDATLPVFLVGSLIFGGGFVMGVLLFKEGCRREKGM